MKVIDDKTRQKISESMKKAHQEGRAHNIGQSRWNNEPSYPEGWFIKVIENDFIDKDYIREYPFFKYSLDFAWPNKKICVEIDGEQHFRNTAEGLAQQKRDKEKDELLKANGWYEIRIPWSTICLNKTAFISFIKDIVDNAKVLNIENEPWYQFSKRLFYCPNCGKEVTAKGCYCRECSTKKSRKVARPNLLTLVAEIYDSNFSEVGKKYGVAPNTVIKWCLWYNLPTHLFDLKNWYRINILNLPEITKKIKDESENKKSVIQQCNLKTHEVLNEFDSYTDAYNKTGITRDNISRVCRGLRKSAGGYFWIYIEK